MNRIKDLTEEFQEISKGSDRVISLCTSSVSVGIYELLSYQIRKFVYNKNFSLS